jgi:coatomer subunit gamma
MYSLPALEHSLVLYISSEKFSEPFDLGAIPVISREESDAQTLRTLTEITPVPTISAEKPKAAAQPTQPTESISQQYAKALGDIPEFKDFGSILKSSLKPIELTEKETEYAVTAVKHIFQDHIVLQFDVSNTLPDTVLENVSVISTPDDEDSGLVEDFIIPAPTISNAAPATIYVSFSRSDPNHFDTANFSNVLKFTSKEVDPDTGEPEETGYDDEYEVDVLTLSAGDYFLPTYIGNFQGVWDSLGAHNEVSDTSVLTSMKSIQGLHPPGPLTNSSRSYKCTA